MLLYISIAEVVLKIQMIFDILETTYSYFEDDIFLEILSRLFA